MHYAESILDLVGDTPLVRISRLTRDLGPADRQPLILAKLEMLNPGGSVKDRIGLPMIEAAERAGLLKPGGTIIEPTSGNTGHGLAIAAALKGYRCIFVMADKQSAEKQALLRAYGAEVVLCPTNVEPESPESYYSVAARLARDIPGAFKPDQYWNPENPTAHERTTGPEIWAQTDGRITHLVARVGTGGTVSGIARYLKAQNPAIRVDRRRPGGQRPVGRHGAPVPDRGRGRGLLPGHLRPRRWSTAGCASRDRDAFAMARRITREEGILAGESCGTAMLAALDEAARLMREEPDGGARRGHRRDPPRRRPELPLQAVQRRVDAGQRPAADDRRRRAGRRAARGATTASRCPTSSSPGPPTASASAIDLLQRVRHQPAARLRAARGRRRSRASSGSVSEKGLLDRAYRNPDVVERTVGEVMDRPLPTIDVAATVDEAFALLSGGATALLVVRGDRPAGRRHQARPARVPRPPRLSALGERPRQAVTWKAPARRPSTDRRAGRRAGRDGIRHRHRLGVEAASRVGGLRSRLRDRRR